MVNVFKLKDYRRLMWLLAGFGIGLRLLLFWANPAPNSYDDHFEPVFKIMTYGSIPSKDACWQCYHPPLFYVISAVIGKLSFNLGADYFQVIKILQFVSCLYGIATIGVIYLILKRLPLSDFARLLAFGTVCFLPRHIYASAMYSNDTMASLGVSGSIYLTIVAIDKRFSPFSLAALSVVAGGTLLTKYPALIVLPAIAVAFGTAFFWGILASRKKIAISFLFIMLSPLFILSWQVVSDIKNYGRPFPSNMGFLNRGTTHIPGKGNMSFLDFKPWEIIKTPILTPKTAKSFWTGVYGSFWFDVEPKFLPFTDPDQGWWPRYYNYLQGKESIWPGIALSNSTRLIGSSLVFLGLVPLSIVLLGFFYSLSGKWGIFAIERDRIEAVKMMIFPILLIGNAAGLIMAAIEYTTFSFLKATYFLYSLSALAVFLGLGVMLLDRGKAVRYTIVAFFTALFFLITIHILQIFLSAKVLPPI